MTMMLTGSSAMGCWCVVLVSLLSMTTTTSSSSSSSSSSSAFLKTKSDYLVTGLDAVVPAYKEFEGDMYAGMIPIHHDKDAERQGEIMFWLFAPHKPLVTDSLVMWLNGGPGCSSFQCGNLFETGPVTVPLHPPGWCCATEDEPLVVNEHTWTSRTYMLFVEQPVGVGFSWGPEPETEDDVTSDMVGWLHNFFAIFSELQEFDFYIFGESYAGMYAPAIARGIHRSNINIDAEYPPIPIKGIGLGNGWIDVQIQGSAVIDYAWWHGMIDNRQRDAFMQEWRTCLYSSPIGRKDFSTDDGLDNSEDDLIQVPYHSFTTPDECGIAGAILKAAGQELWTGKFEPNTYDTTTWDTYPVIQGANTTTLQRFYNNKSIQRALNAPVGQFWAGCVEGAGRRRRLAHIGRRQQRQLIMLDQDRPLSVLPYLAELLDDAGIRVLVYNADLDMSVCAQGSENALTAMQWSGTQEWQDQERGVWTTKTQVDKVAGYARELRGLTFLVVRNSGHMVCIVKHRKGIFGHGLHFLNLFFRFPYFRFLNFFHSGGVGRFLITNRRMPWIC
jgi:carboxypeptidase D